MKSQNFEDGASTVADALKQLRESTLRQGVINLLNTVSENKSPSNSI
jgi:hypothetical protein